MATFEEFEQSLRHALAHFRDPAYRPSELLWSVMGYEPEHGVEIIQNAITLTIESLKPVTANISAGLRSQRFYNLLTYRYIHKLTQDETAERLGITPRHVRREQQQAIHELARRFWEKRPDHSPSLPEAGPEENISSAWRLQVRQELAALQHSAPGSVVEIATALGGVAKIGEALVSQNGASLKIEPIERDMTVAIHPSALRQVLITAIEKLAQSILVGQITLKGERRGERVHLVITGFPATTTHPPESDLIREILAVYEGSVEAYLEENCAGFRISLPTVDKITVLVVDDNEDLVHFYRRYIEGTRYQITHLSEGQFVLETVKNTLPDIIVLDVMLPDIDGWELLTDLRSQPSTQTIPIVVCSVVRRAELALSLGASLYLPKPVRRRQFIQALDQALN
jgi:CheY-like chemotaxis protein